MRNFSFCYDAYQNLEPPDIYLSNPNRRYISDGAILNFDLRTQLYFNNISSLDFVTYYKVNGEINPDYDNILEGNTLYVGSIGWFQITEVQETHEKDTKKKQVTALSFENELCSKYYSSFGSMGVDEDDQGGLDRYWLYNPADIEHSILHIVIDKLPDWKIGHVDTSLTKESRNIEEDSVDGYSLLTNTCSEAWECIFYFDINELTINAYDKDNIGQLSDLYFSYSNIVKSIGRTIDIGNIKTVLYVQGGEYGSSNLGISEVCPTGSNYLYNFDYFKPRMSQELRDKLNEYEEAYKAAQDTYTSLLDQKNQIMIQLEDYTNCVPPETLSDYDSKLSDIEQNINDAIQKASNDYKNYNGTLTRAQYIEQNQNVINFKEQYNNLLQEKLTWLQQQSDKKKTQWDYYGLVELETQAAAREGVCSVFQGLKVNGDSGSFPNFGVTIYDQNFKEIHGALSGSKVYVDGDVKYWYYSGSTDCIAYYIELRKKQIADCEEQIANLNTQLSSIVLNLRTFLGEELYKELSHYVYEDNFSDTSYIATDIMTDSERLQMERDLYEKALKQLYTVSQPNPTFSLDAMNLFAVKDFINKDATVYLGDFVTIELDDDVTEEVRLLKIDIEWKNKDFSLTFSSRTSLAEGQWQLKELRDQASSTANSLNLSGSGWNYSRNQASKVTEYMTSALDTSVQRLKSSSTEEFVMDNTGIRGRAWDNNTNTYSPEEIWMTKNLICFSDDNFATSKMAIGKIPFENDEVYGVIADVIVGNLVAGQNLLISNTNGSFAVNGDGVKISDLDLKIYDKPSNGGTGGLVRIGNRNNSEYIMDIDGEKHYVPFCIGTSNDGTTFANKKVYYDMTDNEFVIKSGTLEAAKINSPVLKGGSIAIGGTDTNPKFYVDNNGNLTSTSATIKGTIEATSGTFNGTINATGGTFSGNITASGTITGGTITGATISSGAIKGGSININNRFLVDSYGDVSIYGGSININNRFKVSSNGDITLPDNAVISWTNVNGRPTDLNDFTDRYGTYITQTSIHTVELSADQITAGTLSGDYIDGGTITGTTIKSTSGSLSTTISGGTITTNNINITGGNIDISTPKGETSVITLNWANTRTRVAPAMFSCELTNSVQGVYISPYSIDCMSGGEHTITMNYSDGYIRVKNYMLINNRSVLKDGDDIGYLKIGYTTYGNIKLEDCYGFITESGYMYGNPASTGWVKGKVAGDGSDRRIKKDIIDLPDLTSFYMSLKPRQFEFDEIDGKEGLCFGLVAQEVEEALQDNGLDPKEYNIVSQREPVPWKGESKNIPEGDKLHYINWDNVNGMSIYMIQNLYKKVQEQEEVIKELQNKIK